MNKVITIAFAAICAALFIMNFAPERDFSDVENRTLSHMPKFSWKALFSDRYTSKFETYIQDQFFAREFWVKLKNESEIALQKKDVGGAYFLKDGGYAEKRDLPKEGQLEKNLSTLESFDKNAVKKGIQSYFLAIPSVGTIYPERLPEYSPYPNEEETLSRISSSLNFSVTDPIAALRKEKNQKLYFETDHHWTQRAAFLAYQELGEVMGFVPKSESDFQVKTLEEFYGSLYSKAPHFGVKPDVVEYFVNPLTEVSIEYLDHNTTDNSFYTIENFKVKDKYTIFLNGNNSEILISTKAKSGRSLLVAKDSFSHSLIPFLAEHFENIYVVDLRYFVKPFMEYCEEKGVTDVLFSYNVSWFADDVNIVRVK